MRLIRFSVFCLLWLNILSWSAFAQVIAVPSAMNFQGRLAKPDGTPVANGNYTLTLSLFNAPTGGTLLWTQNFVNTPVNNGAFAVKLNFASGYQNGAAQNSLFGAAAVSLEIKVGTDNPLTPRQQLVTVAYAFKANAVADGSITGSSLAAGSITADKFAANIFNPLAWLLNGNSGITSGFLGTTDNHPLVFKANNHQAMRYSYAENTATAGKEYRSINVLGGSELNTIKAGVVGATIAGGGLDNFSGTDYYQFVAADFATIGGGDGNFASGAASTIAGGIQNTAVGTDDFIGGGFDNSTGGFGSAIGGGVDNFARNDYATVGGGAGNNASDFYSTISGGFSNTASAYASAVGGGFANTASGDNSFVAGGEGNTASGIYSFAAGLNAQAKHNGTFVWADYTINSPFASTGPNAFLIRASGGVGINTNSPQGPLHVKGEAGVFNLEGGSQVYMQFFPRGFAAGRKGYMGFPSAGSHDLVIANEDTGVLRVVGTFVNSSDVRYKTNIASLDKALSLRGVSYDWRKNVPGAPTSTQRQIGFIAQEMEKILPDLVYTDEKGYKSVNYIGVVPVLVEAIKTLKAELDDKQKQIDILRQQQAEIAELKSQLAALTITRKAEKRP